MTDIKLEVADSEQVVGFKYITEDCSAQKWLQQGLLQENKHLIGKEDCFVSC